MERTPTLAAKFPILRSVGLADPHGRLGPAMIFFFALLSCGPSLVWSLRFGGLSSCVFGLLACCYLSARIVRSYWNDDPRLPLILAFTIAVCGATQILATGVALKINGGASLPDWTGEELLRIGRLMLITTVLLLIGSVVAGVNYFGLPETSKSVGRDETTNNPMDRSGGSAAS